MAISNTSDPPKNMESSTGPAMTLLIEHLSRHDAKALESLLGPSTIELLSKTLDPVGNNPKGLAYFLVRIHGDHEVLRRPEIRILLLSKLSHKEATELCELLQKPAISPHQTLAGINFDTARNLELLGRWYGVDSDELQMPIQHPEGSQKAIAPHKLRAHQLSAFRELRRAIESPSNTLVHMPFGSGKMRLVATAVLDFFRSVDDDRAVVWFAPGAAMCEEAFSELRDVWKQLGSRDITLLQLYGIYPSRDLDRLGGTIAVIDILRVAKNDPALLKLGANTGVAILADAQNLVHPVGAGIVQKMSTGGQFPLVGILASSGAAIPPGAGRDDLQRAYSRCITVSSGEEDLVALRNFGEFTHISGSVVQLTDAQSFGQAAPDASDDLSLEFDPDYVIKLDTNVQRNENLLALLQKESQANGRIVFYATTPSSARLFASLLPVLGIPAVSVTSDESPAARTIAIQRFISREERGVLCIHGFLLTGSSIPDLTLCVMASPTRSKATFLSTIGRIVQARDEKLTKLRLVVTADSQVDATLVESLDKWTTLGSWPKLTF